MGSNMKWRLINSKLIYIQSIKLEMNLINIKDLDLDLILARYQLNYNRK